MVFLNFLRPHLTINWWKGSVVKKLSVAHISYRHTNCVFIIVVNIVISLVVNVNVNIVFNIVINIVNIAIIIVVTLNSLL